MSSEILSVREKTRRQFFKPFFYYDVNTFLSNFNKSGQIAPTMPKQPLTKEVVAKLTKKVSLLTLTPFNNTNCSKQPGFFISLFLGKRSRENQHQGNQQLLKSTCSSREKQQVVKNIWNEQRAWSSVGDQKPPRWPQRQRRRVKRQNIRKTWLKTLPGETHREIPVTSEFRVQQFISETTKPVQIT